jgi:molybdopterin-guanine dinucleotide biosynthesis protein A
MGGVQKALLEIEGRRIVDRQLDVLLPLFDEVLFVVADGEWDIPRARVVFDRNPGKGPLAGLQTVLDEDVFVVACDLPFLDENLIRQICSQEGNVVPRVDGDPQPLHARYARSAQAIVDARIARGELRMMRFLDELRPTYLDFPMQRGFTNVNTRQGLTTLT